MSEHSALTSFLSWLIKFSALVQHSWMHASLTIPILKGAVRYLVD